MHFLKDYYPKYRGSIFLGQFFKLIEAVLELLIPLVMADLIDRGVALNDKGLIVSRAGLMVLLAFVGICCALVCQVVATKASVRFGTELRHDVFSHINRLSPQDLDDIGTASLVTRMTGDINNLQDALAMLIRLVVRAPFLAIGSVVMAIILDVQLSVVFLITTPLIAVSMFAVLRMTAPRFSRLQSKLDVLGRMVRETLSGTRVIRAFSQEKDGISRFQKAAQDYTADALKTGRLSALLSPVTSVIMNLGILGVLLLGGNRVNTGDMEVGIVIAFVEYLAQILLQTAVVANLVMLYTRAFASAKRVGELMDMHPSVKDVRWTDRNAPPSHEAVRFDHVSIRYPDGKVALQDISFTLNKGETLGIIGGTGAGKSSVASLLLRFYDATEGTVLVGGEDVKRIPLKSLRQRVALVPQRAALLKGTIRDNLSLGDELITQRMMHKALSIAQADFVHQYPEGLDYVVEENGRNLSGGQRQRLTIARALLRKPDILILDDAFSALDFVTESRLRGQLKENRGEEAHIYISQRVASLRHADKILVLDEGRAVGLDTHENLLKSNSIYQEICLSQRQEEEASA